MNPRIVLLAGVGRSGSTLLSRLLGQVPGVCSVGELCFLWEQGVLSNRQCGCGLEFADCPFWSQVGLRAFDGWENVDARAMSELRRSVERVRFVPALATGAAGPRFESRVHRYAALMSRVYHAISAVSGCEVVVDASKYPSAAYLARRTPEIDVRLLHLVRRSQGVAFSWAKVVNRPDRDGKPLARFSPARTATDWNVYNLLVECIAMLRTPYLRVRYEDFVADPEVEMRRILRLSDIDDRLDLDFIKGSEVELRSSHSVAGNPMRFRTGAEQLVPDDQWRTDMPPAARRLVTTLTLPGLVRYGYASARSGR